ncbi:Hypothetical protein D9617_11g008700 [Elsinoe fawcettii]|nr:Hypothetical protein D9617_11g008700 [Elsinoe fawcettii]
MRTIRQCITVLVHVTIVASTLSTNAGLGRYALTESISTATFASDDAAAWPEPTESYDRSTDTRVLSRPYTEDVATSFGRTSLAEASAIQDVQRPGIPNADTNTGPSHIYAPQPPEQTSTISSTTITAEMPITENPVTTFGTPTNIPTVYPSPATAIPGGNSLQTPDHDPDSGAATSPPGGITVSPDPAQGGIYVANDQPFVLGDTITIGTGAEAVRVAAQTADGSGAGVNVVVQASSTTWTTALITAAARTGTAGDYASNRVATSANSPNPSSSASSRSTQSSSGSSGTRSGSVPSSRTSGAVAPSVTNAQGSGTSIADSLHGAVACLIFVAASMLVL